MKKFGVIYIAAFVLFAACANRKTVSATMVLLQPQ